MHSIEPCKISSRYKKYWHQAIQTIHCSANCRGKTLPEKKENHVPTSFLHKNLIKKCSGPNTPVLPWRAGKIGGKIDHSRPSDQKWLFNYLPSHLTFFFFGKVIPMSWGSRGSETDFFFSPSKMSWTQLDNDHRVGCSWSLAAVVEFFYQEYKKDYRHVINFPGARRLRSVGRFRCTFLATTFSAG